MIKNDVYEHLRQAIYCSIAKTVFIGTHKTVDSDNPVRFDMTPVTEIEHKSTYTLK